VGERIAAAAERYSLLPQDQMGNRPGRLIELAIRIVTDTVYITWKGVEIGLCTSSRERLGIYFAEPTQRRIRIAGVKRDSSGS
jgi:hypothetical protein